MFQDIPAALAAFSASLVEFVEALTVVLAVGAVRGWQSALGGTAGALAVLVALVVVLGPALTLIPLRIVHLVMGVLLLLFGLRWLRKAVLRAAGRIPLHDEAALYTREAGRLAEAAGERRGFDALAVSTAFKITMVEGLEVVFIVIATSAGGLIWPASLGALAALLLVILLGVALHRPLTRVPENTVKFAVGVLLTGFGLFWTGEGLGLAWPGGDVSLAGLVAVLLLASVIAVRWVQAGSIPD